MFFKKTPKYLKHTEYNKEKINKRENYTLLNRKYALQGQTVLVGDSITEIFNWYELFYDWSKMSGQAVYNRGISGDFTNRLLERLNDNVLNINPKNLVLLIGTNDVGREIPLEMSVSNVDEILKGIRQKCPDANIILQAVYPVNLNMRDRFEKRSNEKIKAMNAQFIKLSEKYNCRWLDITAQLSDENGDLSKEYCYDGLHLNAKGFEIVAENVIPLLKN